MCFRAGFSDDAFFKLYRDIKGANILVDPIGRVKLADFGMAKHVSHYNRNGNIIEKPGKAMLKCIIYVKRC